MFFISTRNPRNRSSLSNAIVQGIAPDGGLYIPESLPRFRPQDFAGIDSLAPLAEKLLAPFAAEDPLSTEVGSICRDAFSFPAPLVRLSGTPSDAYALELFHGPTAAFKDFGARFLAASLERIRRNESRKLTILVATSGDTGGAVAAAFHRRPGFDVGVLYPKGLVSARQAHQLSCWGDNIRTFVVGGTFDECQRMVKEAFLDPSLLKTHALSSANSINIGRLLPQMVYYAHASLALWRISGEKPSFVIPSGNVGNASACILAKLCGLPIGRVAFATNANRTIGDYLHSGEWRPRPSIATIANAMDVGNPSNMERLRALFPTIESLRAEVTADSVTDDEIRARISHDARSLNHIWCPHSAAAAEVYRRRFAGTPGKTWIIVSTAHPAKFNDIVEPLIGRTIPLPDALARLLTLPRFEREIAPSLDALRSELQA